jgi:hypothetical protein
MNDCYFEKKDWRLCKNEVSEGFPACWLEAVIAELVTTDLGQPTESG